MPLVTIHLQAGTRTRQERKAISDALHTAMKDVLGIPADDRFHVFSEVPEGNLLHEDVAFGIPRGEKFMFITFSFNRRSPEMKREFFATVVSLLRQVGVSEHDLGLRILEPAPENWWASGRLVDPETGWDERMKETEDGTFRVGDASIPTTA